MRKGPSNKIIQGHIIGYYLPLLSKKNTHDKIQLKNKRLKQVWYIVLMSGGQRTMQYLLLSLPTLLLVMGSLTKPQAQ